MVMDGKLYLEATVKTPEVEVNPTEGILIMKGRSLPEDAIEFYEPVFAALNVATAGKDFFTLKFYLEYLNTSSSSIIRSVMEYFADKKLSGDIDFIIEWYYEEDDFEMEEMGKHYEQTIDNLPVKFIEVDAL